MPEPLSYITPGQIRDYLTQIPPNSVTDEQLTQIGVRATAICNDSVVGLGFAFAGYTTGSRPVLSTHSPYLLLPPHQLGSVSAISLYGTALTAGQDYTVLSDGVHETLYRTTTQAGPGWWPPPQRDSWGWMGYYYDVTAAWGYGPPPASLVEVALEVAVNIWRSRDAGRFTNVIGATGGGAVGYECALTPLQRSVLQGLRNIYTRDVVAI